MAADSCRWVVFEARAVWDWSPPASADAGSKSAVASMTLRRKRAMPYMLSEAPAWLLLR